MGRQERCWAYVRQAQADMELAQRIRGLDEGGDGAKYGYHVIALSQQATEKSIKGLYYLNTDDDKPLRHRAAGLVETMVRPGTPLIYARDLRRGIANLFTHERRSFVRRVDNVCPRLDAAQSTPNTEYPFICDNTWVAPCDDGALSSLNPEEFLGNARAIVDGIERMRSAVARAYARTAR